MFWVTLYTHRHGMPISLISRDQARLTPIPIYSPGSCGVLYSGSLSSGSDVSTQTQLLSACTHSLFLRAREPVCAISLGARDLALRWANKRTMSLPEDGEPEYRRYVLVNFPSPPPLHLPMLYDYYSMYCYLQVLSYQPCPLSDSRNPTRT